MKAPGVTHVSMTAPDLEASVRFYTDVFGMERLPAPTFAGQAVVWLRLGDQQLHLMQRDGTAQLHHFGLDGDDFEAAYRKVRELEVRDDTTFVSGIVELPGGEAQMYLRDPAGNLVEVNWPDASSLDRSVVGDLVRLVDMVPQNDEGMAAHRYTGTARQPLGER
jgi:YD repeat-containing protein